jgi:hypothetical protein
MVDSLPSTPTMVSAANLGYYIVPYSLACSIANQLHPQLTPTRTPTMLPLRQQQHQPLLPIVAILLGVVLGPAVLLAALVIVAPPTEVRGAPRPLSARPTHPLFVF